MRGGKSKTQVTMYIIIVMFVLVVVSFSLISYKDYRQKDIETAQTKVIQSKISSTQFKDFMNSCLDTALSDSIYLLGMQGGVIYKDQGGNFNLEVKTKEYNYKSKKYDVIYLDEGYVANSFLELEPNYPCLKNTYPFDVPQTLRLINCKNNFTYADLDYSKYIKISDFQKMGKSIDMNMPLCSEKKEINASGYFQRVCYEARQKARYNYTWEEQIKSYIVNKMESCYDESQIYLRDELSAEVTSRGDFNLSIMFTDEKVVAYLNFPLELTFDNYETITDMFSFTSESDIRLKIIYSFIYGNSVLLKNYNSGIFSYNTDGIVRNEMNKLYYDLDKSSRKWMSKYFIEGINISRSYDEDGNFIQIEDSKSKHRGSNYVFNVRLHNKPPALNTFSYYPSESYDVSLDDEEILLLMPLAIDPDDGVGYGNSLTYEYEILDSDWKWREKFFYDNELYKNGIQGDISCIHPEYGLTKNRCTSFLLNSSDLGEHLLRIKVIDSSGAEDSQDVKIFVDSNSDIKLEIDNVYGISKKILSDGEIYSIVSEEDPFFLNFSGSVFSGGKYTDKIFWNDTKNNNIIQPSFTLQELKKTDTEIIMPPYNAKISPDKYYNFSKASLTYDDILNNPYVTEEMITLYHNSLLQYYNIFDINEKSGYPFEPSIRKTKIKLDYFKHNILVNSTSKNVYVAECIPIRSDIPSYPFNFIRTQDLELSTNPFIANHTCCIGDVSNPETWTTNYGAKCYNRFEVGTYYDFMEDPEKLISENLFKKVYPDFNSIPDLFISSDVLVPLPEEQEVARYVRIVQGECRDRGNVCEPTKYKILKIPYCGYDYDSLPNIKDLKVKDTSLPNLLPDGYYDYINDRLCVAWDQNTYQPIIINISEGTSLNEKYVCFNNDDVPYKIQDLPCEMQECEKINVLSTPPLPTSPTVSSTGFDRVRQSPSPLCKCGSMVVDISVDGGKFCCNPHGSYSLGDFSYCNEPYA